MATGDQSFAYRGTLNETAVDIANLDWSAMSDGLLGVHSGQLVPVTLATNQLSSSYSAPNLILSLSNPCVAPGSFTVNSGFTFGSATGLLRRDLGIVSSVSDGSSTDFLRGDMTWQPISASVRSLLSAASPLSYNSTTGIFSLPLSTSSDYLRGDGTWVNFTTTSRASISASSPLSYNSGTGVMSLPLSTSSDYLRGDGTWVDFVTSARASFTAGSGITIVSGVISNSATAPSYNYPLSITGSTVSLGYNSTNLRLTSNQLNTIQDIATSSSPTFVRLINTSECLTVGSGANQSVCIGGSVTSIGANLRNVFIGRAGSGSATGTRNVLIGIDCAPGITTGQYNTCLGDLCGYGITTGQRNVLIGANNAAASNPSYTTIVGMSSCAGSNVSAIGYQAGQQNTADANVFVGFESGYICTGTGSVSNVYIGSSAGRGLTSGTHSYNTIIGAAANRNASVNNYNVMIGAHSGHSVTTGSSNVLIGYYAGYFLTTQSNQLYIANSSTTTPLIQGDFSTKNLIINDNLACKKLAIGTAPSVAPTNGLSVQGGIVNDALTADRFVMTDGSKNLISSSFLEYSGSGNYTFTYGGGSTSVTCYWQAIGSTKFTYSFHLPLEISFTPSSSVTATLTMAHTAVNYLQGALQCRNGGNDVLGYWYMNAGSNVINIMPDGDNRTFFFSGSCKVYPVTITWMA